jgi:hypothetical protein
MDLHEMNYPDVFTTSDSTTKITNAIVNFNTDMGVISKKSKNPFFKSAYADLPTVLGAVKDPMIKNGLTINHFPIGDNRLLTRLSHSSGEFYQGLNYMKSVKDTPQDRGSVITYMMRYAVGAYLGLSIDKDDDGNKSTGNGAKKAEPVLMKLTDTVKDAMLKFIENGDADTVSLKMPKYQGSANKTVVIKAISDYQNVKDLECDATVIDIEK